MDPRRTVPWFALALLLATAALSLAAAGDGVLPGDVRLARWLQAHPIPLADPLTSFTNDYASGRPLTLAGIAVAGALLAARRGEAALLVALATALRATNSLLKALHDSPRPTADLVRVTEQADGLGFPSGHAMGAALVIGAVAYLIARASTPLSLRQAAIALCLLSVLLTGYGRVHTGAHWPSDVLGGFLWGALLLTLSIRATRLLPRPGARTRSLASDGGRSSPGLSR